MMVGSLFMLVAGICIALAPRMAPRVAARQAAE